MLESISTKIPKKKSEQHDVIQEKKTLYLTRLKEKQKLKYYYGVSEKQLTNYIKLAKRLKGSTGKIFLQLLEMRLDNLIFQAFLVNTISAARQLINHKHVLVNHSIISIPGYQCQPGDIIKIKKIEKIVFSKIPSHLSFDKNKNEVNVMGIVNWENPFKNISEFLIIEFYSQKI